MSSPASTNSLPETSQNILASSASIAALKLTASETPTLAPPIAFSVSMMVQTIVKGDSTVRTMYGMKMDLAQLKNNTLECQRSEWLDTN